IAVFRIERQRLIQPLDRGVGLAGSLVLQRDAVREEWIGWRALEEFVQLVKSRHGWIVGHGIACRERMTASNRMPSEVVAYAVSLTGSYGMLNASATGP